MIKLGLALLPVFFLVLFSCQTAVPSSGDSSSSASAASSVTNSSSVSSDASSSIISSDASSSIISSDASSSIISSDASSSIISSSSTATTNEWGWGINGVVNPGFEDGTNGWNLENGYPGITTNEAHSGSLAMVITSSGEAFAQYIQATNKNAVYAFQIYVKGDGVSGARIGTEIWSSNIFTFTYYLGISAEINFITSNAWVPYQLFITNPQTNINTFVKIFIQNNSSGTILYDDVSLAISNL